LISRIFFRSQRWRARNKEIKSTYKYIVAWKERVKDWFFNVIFELPFLKTSVYGKFNDTLEKEEAVMIK
jgi:hypothetical protein